MVPKGTDNILNFTTNSIPSKHEVIEAKSYTSNLVNINDTAYFEIPQNLEANADNDYIKTASASEMSQHFRSIIENL